MASSSSNPPTAVASTRVPRLPLGALYDNPRLPATVPIVGLGCSSFSTFFWTSAEQAALTTPTADNDDIGWTADTLNRHHPKVQEWIETIRYAIVECGITLLDTAPWYGHGTSEVVLGWALPEILATAQEKSNDSNDSNTAIVIQRSELTINTKVGRYQADPKYQFDYSYETTLSSVDRSLQRMNLSYVDVLQLHDPEFAPNLQVLLEQTIPAMIYCQQHGKCKALGMTGYPLQVQHVILERTLELLKQQQQQQQPNGDEPPSPHGIWDQALTYGHFNLHDTSLVSQPLSLLRHHASSTDRPPSSLSHLSFAQYCQHHQIALLAAAPLSLGLLTPQGPPVWHPASEDLKQACLEATALAKERNVNIATLAMVVALAHPRIPCTILGMKNVAEVQVAAAVANRFHHVTYPDSNDDNDDLSAYLSGILSQVLDEQEFQVWKLLQDPEQGPFAQVWKNGNFQWDWMQQAKDFWKQVEGVEFQAWANEPL